MNVREILTSWLKEHGYDGLCCDGCGCRIEDMAICNSCFDDCLPAYKIICDDEDCATCEYLEDCSGPEMGDFIMCSKKL